MILPGPLRLPFFHASILPLQSQFFAMCSSIQAYRYLVCSWYASNYKGYPYGVMICVYVEMRIFSWNFAFVRGHQDAVGQFIFVNDSCSVVIRPAGLQLGELQLQP